MSDSAGAASATDLGRYVRILRRHWVTCVLVTVIGISATYGYLSLSPQRVTASTMVNINVITSTPFGSGRANADLVDAQTEEQVARSSSVISEVARELGGDFTTSEIRAALSVTVLPEATVVRIAYTAGSADTAVQGANAVADAYLHFRGEQARDQLDSIAAQYADRRQEIVGELASVNRQLAKAPPGSGAEARAESARQALQSDLDSLVSQANTLQAVDTNGGTVLTTAEDAALEVAPRRNLVMVTGLLASVIVGIVVAFLAQVLDRRVRDAYDVAGAGGGLVLTRLRTRRGTAGDAGEDADAIWSLRERLLASLPADDPVLSVAEVNSGHENLDVEVNLALAIAASGIPVELIVPEHSEACVWAVRRALGMRVVRQHGAWQQLAGEAHSRLTLRVPTDKARQRTLPVDIVADLLRGDQGPQGMTLIALPPGASRSLILTAGRLGHAVVLAVTESETRIDQLARVATELTAVGATVHGSVMLPRGRRMVGVRSDAAVGSDGAAGDVVGVRRRRWVRPRSTVPRASPVTRGQQEGSSGKV